MFGLDKIYDLWFGDRKNKRVLVSSDELEASVTDICQALANTIVPTLSNMVGVIKPEDLEKSEILTALKKSVKAKNNLDVIIAIKNIAEEIVSCEVKIKRAISKTIPKVTTDKTITVRELGIMNFVDALSIFESFTCDMIFQVGSDISKHMEVKKMMKERMISYNGTYGDILAYFYSDHTEKLLEKALESATNTVKDLLDLNDSMQDQVIKDNGGGSSLISNISKVLFPNKLNGSAGFVGNPFYHLGLLWEDYQKSRNDKRILAKQAMEELLLELKNQRSDVEDPQLEKRIKFYSDRLHKIEYEILSYNRKYDK